MEDKIQGEDGEGGIILLGRWLENQKSFYKRGELLPERYARLRVLGVDFGKQAKLPPPREV